jgi:hypothetical protein
VNSTGDASPLVSFRPLSDEPGLEISDDVAELRYTVRTDSDVSLEAADVEQFPFPVDEAVAFTAETLRVPATVSLLLRDESGEFAGDFFEGPRYVPRGTHYVEADYRSKTYFRFEDVAFTGRHPDTADESALATFRFAEPARVVVGVRSAHTRPSGNIEVPDDPTATMEAVSHLGSSMKEFSPERSWPRLRGHPPAIELGDELAVPDHIERPETGLAITVPPTYEAVYTTAPLAYYLGATVTPGDRPTLRTPSGLSYQLETSDEPLADAVDRLLIQCFVLDTLTRVGGYYDLPRIEYEKVAPHLPFYPPALYDEPVWRQVEQYLEVDFSDIAPHVPRWPVRATLRPGAEDVAAVSPLLDDLGLIRTGGDAPTDGSPGEVTLRRSGLDTVDQFPCTPPARHGGTAERPTGSEQRSVVRADYDAYTTGEVPITGGVLVPETYRRRHDRPRWPVDEAPITVVCNDSDRRSDVERAVESLRTRESLPSLDVTLVDGATTAELRAALESAAGAFHYVGPVTADGFLCDDGVLDPASVETCGPTVLLVTAAETPAAAVELAERGVDAAVVTLGDGPDAEAVDALARVAELLNAGYPVAPSATLVCAPNPCVEYVIVGDGGLELTHLDPGDQLISFTVDSQSRDAHDVTATAVAGAGHELGASARLKGDRDRDNVFLTSTCVDQPVPLDTDELVDFVGPYTAVRLNHEPVHLGAELTPELVANSVE